MRLLLFLTFLFSFGLATDYNGIIYTWGYGELIKNTLEAIRGLIDNNGLTTIFKIAMGISFLLFTFKKAMNDTTSIGLEFAKMMTLFAAVWYLFLTAPDDSKHKYLIHDNVTNDEYVVQQVPTGIGEPLMLISKLENAIAEKMEKYFSLPNSIEYRNSGIGFPLQAHYSLNDVDSGDIYFQRTYTEFIQNCTLYEIQDGDKDTATIMTANNLLDALNPNGDTRLTKVYSSSNPDGEVVSCDSAYNDYLQDEITGSKIDKLMALAAALNSTDVQVFQTRLDDVPELFFNTNTDARDYLQQNWLINLTSKALKSAAAQSGLPDSVVAYAGAMADQTAKNTFVQSGMLAKEYLPIIKGVLVTIIVAISWILALMSVVFADTRHIKLYFTMLFWIMMWTPILVVINYIADMYAAKVFTTMYNESGQEVTMFTKSFVDGKTSTTLAWLGYLVWLTPLLAYSIVKASEQGFTMLATSLSSAVGGAASSAASTANQMSQSTMPSIRTRAGVTTDLPGVHQNTNYSMDTNGNLTKQDRFTNSNTEVNSYDINNGTSKIVANSNGVVGAESKVLNGAIGQGYKTAFSQMISQAKQRATTIANEYGSSVSSAISSAISSSSGLTHNFNQNLSIDQRKGLATAVSQSSSQAFETSEQSQEANRFFKKFEASIQGGGGTDFKIAKVNGGVSYSYSDENGHIHTFTDTSKNALQTAQKFEETLGKTMAKTEGLGNVYQHSLNSSDTNSINTIKSENEKLTDAYSQVDSYNKQLSLSQDEDGNVKVNALPALLNAMKKDGWSETNAMNYLNGLATKGKVGELANLMKKYDIFNNKDIQEQIKMGSKNVNGDGLKQINPNQVTKDINTNANNVKITGENIKDKVEFNTPTDQQLKDKFDNTAIGSPVKQPVKQDDEATRNVQVSGALSKLFQKYPKYWEAELMPDENSKPKLNSPERPTLTQQKSGVPTTETKTNLPSNIDTGAETGVGGIVSKVLKGSGIASIFKPTILGDSELYQGSYKGSSSDGDLIGDNEVSVMYTANGEQKSIDTNVNYDDWVKYLKENPDKAQELSEMKDEKTTFAGMNLATINNAKTPEELYQAIKGNFSKDDSYLTPYANKQEVTTTTSPTQTPPDKDEATRNVFDNISIPKDTGVKNNVGKESIGNLKGDIDYTMVNNTDGINIKGADVKDTTGNIAQHKDFVTKPEIRQDNTDETLKGENKPLHHFQMTYNDEDFKDLNYGKMSFTKTDDMIFDNVGISVVGQPTIKTDVDYKDWQEYLQTHPREAQYMQQYMEISNDKEFDFAKDKQFKDDLNNAKTPEQIAEAVFNVAYRNGVEPASSFVSTFDINSNVYEKDGDKYMSIDIGGDLIKTNIPYSKETENEFLEYKMNFNELYMTPQIKDGIKNSSSLDEVISYVNFSGGQGANEYISTTALNSMSEDTIINANKTNTPFETDDIKTEDNQTPDEVKTPEVNKRVDEVKSDNVSIIKDNKTSNQEVKTPESKINFNKLKSRFKNRDI